MKKGIRKDKNVFGVGVIIFRLNGLLNTKCHNCSIVEHISRKYLISKAKDVKKHLQNSTNLLEGRTVVNKNEDFDNLYHIYRNANENSRPTLLEITLNRHLTELQLDTEASLTIISTKTFDIIKKGLEEVKMMNSSVKFKTYSGETIKTLGKVLIPVCYNSHTFISPSYVIEREKQNFL